MKDALVAVDSPSFDLELLWQSESGIYAAGVLEGMLGVASLGEDGEWGESNPLTAVTENAVLRGCGTQAGWFYMVVEDGGELVLWEGDGEAWLPSPTELVSYEKWVCTEESPSGVVLNDLGEWEVRNGYNGAILGVISSGMQGGGPLSILDGKMMAAGVDLNGDVAVGRFPVNGNTPAIGGTRPHPLVAGQNGEVLGFNLASGTTVFAFDGEITTFGAEVPAIFSFFVPQEATGGLHTLTVTTEEGQDAASVLVLAAPPVIHEVLPTSPKLGELVVVDGKHLEQVETVFVGDTEQVLASKDLGAVTFYLSPDTELGSQNLEVISPTGSASVLVSVLLPPPSLVKVSPNPATVGGVLEVTGEYMENVSLVSIGGTSSAILEAGENSVKVLVNGDTPVGQHMVSVTAEGGTSASFGPISVLPPVKDGFGVSELLPASAAPGQEIFVRGEKLDIVSEVWVNGVVAEWSSEGDKERRLRIPETSAGETEMQFFGPDQVVTDFLHCIGK